jgi:hypothetical protein
VDDLVSNYGTYTIMELILSPVAVYYAVSHCDPFCELVMREARNNRFEFMEPTSQIVTHCEKLIEFMKHPTTREIITCFSAGGKYSESLLLALVLVVLTLPAPLYR